MSEPRYFDWPLLMRTGMRGLGLRPAEFWALTPAEFALLVGETSGKLPLDRAGLAALQARFPDLNEDQDATDG